MTKIPAILSATLTATLAACADDHTPIGQPLSTPLITAEAQSVGSVTVYNSTDGLFVTTAPGKGWELKETRLAVSTRPGGLPKAKGGGPNLDRFLLRMKKVSASGEMTFALPLAVESGTELFIALYAELNQTATGSKGDSREDADCDPNDKTIAWGLGTTFVEKLPGAMYFSYTVQAAAPPTQAGMFRTHSQESWGGAPDGTNAASYLSANFAAAFPFGVKVGSSLLINAQFTTAQAVADFLPQSGTPGVLTGHSVNPVNLANPFAGATLALALNTGFDEANAAFSSSSVLLSSLVVADPSSPLYGIPVGDVLAMANQYLSGSAPSTSVPLQDLFDAVTRINANFEDGSVDLGFLGMP